METATATRKVPTEQDIAAQEAKLNEMRLAREEARKSLIATLKSQEMLAALSPEDAMQIMRALQMKMRGSRRRTRGVKVPETTKARLEHALIEGNYTLSELERTFNLSVSYISRIKRSLREAGKLDKDPVMNA